MPPGVRISIPIPARPSAIRRKTTVGSVTSTAPP
jgi:hypothetical protein